jgi:sugar lactone lactonase YvrE
MSLASTQLVGGLHFGEGPRWHEGRLWFSDFYDHAIKSVSLAGDLRIEHQLDEQTSGLGWLPDGRLLVVAMASMRLLVAQGDQLEAYADLSPYSRHLCNDMVVDGAGRAWVGNFGFDLDAVLTSENPDEALADPPHTNLVRVDPDGTVSIAATEMYFPNGSVVTPDGRQLIVAETIRARLTAFDIAADGSLDNRREWASTPDCAPDGICLAEDGNIWVANALLPEAILYAPGGEIVDKVSTSQPCFACMLGGEDGRDLFLVTAGFSDKPRASVQRTGKIELARAPAAHSGWP